MGLDEKIDIRDVDDIEDDEGQQLYEHLRIVVDKGQVPLRHMLLLRKEKKSSRSEKTISRKAIIS